MTSVVVFGGSGFIGTRLVAGLTARGNDVRIADIRESTAYPRLWRFCDITDGESVAALCEGADAICHLAAVHHDNVRPVEKYYDVNVEGTRNIAAAAARHGIGRIVFTSSVAVYGFTGDEPVGEDHPHRPFNHYGKSKSQAEAVLDEWHGRHGGTLVTARPTAVFGPGNRGNVYNLVRQVASNTFLMVGDGTNRKSLAHVDNVAAFLLECLTLPPGRHVFNYADKPDFTMNELVALLRGLAGKKAAPGPRLPRALGLMGGHLADATSRLTGRTFPISAVRVRKFTENTIFRSDALPKLNFTPPVPLRDGMEQFFRAEFGEG